MLTKVDKIRVYATLKQPFCPLRHILFCEEFNSWLAHKINYKNDYSNWWYMMEDSLYKDKFSTIMDFFIEWILEKESCNISDVLL